MNLIMFHLLYRTILMICFIGILCESASMYNRMLNNCDSEIDCINKFKYLLEISIGKTNSMYKQNKVFKWG